jgi:hypothetical protein
MSFQKKSKLLLHICCAPCSAYVFKKLRESFEVAGYFYNPNLYPGAEYEKRLEEVKSFSKKFGIEIFFPKKYEKDRWLEFISGHEDEPESGERCKKCYRFRLQNTANMAAKMHFKYFTTTLSISPYKNAKMINLIGKEMGGEFGVEFLADNFKKNGGFNESVELSKKHGFYRQNYCGCEFSIRNKE